MPPKSRQKFKCSDCSFSCRLEGMLTGHCSVTGHGRRQESAAAKPKSRQESKSAEEDEREVKSVTQDLEHVQIDDGPADQCQSPRSIQIRDIVPGGPVTLVTAAGSVQADAAGPPTEPLGVHSNSTYCAGCGIQFDNLGTLSSVRILLGSFTTTRSLHRGSSTKPSTAYLG